MKKLATLLLAVLLLGLLAGTALADAGLENFQGGEPYDGRFTDVPKSAWYYDSVGQAVSFGLIKGMTPTTYEPDSTLTPAECVTLAARLHSIYETGAEGFEQGQPWYRVYADYAIENGILETDLPKYGGSISRADFAVILSRAFPDEALEPINDVPDGSIPDVGAKAACRGAMYRLYRAGVLMGNDPMGSALPDNPIRRSEAAAILIRMADPAQRRSFSLTTELTVYKPDGSTKTVPATELAAAEAQGWYRYPVTMVYSASGSMAVYTHALETYLKQGWSTEPFIPVPDVYRDKTATSIPVLSVSTGGREVLSRTDYVACGVSTFNVPADQALSSEQGGIRVRGNSASYYGNVSMIRSHQVPYRLKFDSKVNLLGLNGGAKCKSWVLCINNGGTVDAVKNDIAFRMGRKIVGEDGYYCSDGQFVNFFLNGQYKGVYLLCEQNQVNKKRVNVAEPEDGDTSVRVGYFVEIDNYSEPPYFRMNYEGAAVTDQYGNTRTFRGADYSIKSDVFSKEQEAFIAKYIRGVFKIVYQACEKGNYLTFDDNYNVVPSSFTNAKDCVSAVADVRSMADMCILYELMCDYDVGEGSFYMCVDFSEDSKFPKLTFTAPWDFEWTCSASTSGLFASIFRNSSFISSYGDRSNPWFIVLYKQSWFRDLLHTRWREIGGAQGIAQCIAEENALLTQYGRDMNRKDSSTVDASRANLNWIQRRANWLETVWG